MVNILHKDLNSYKENSPLDFNFIRLPGQLFTYTTELRVLGADNYKQIFPLLEIVRRVRRKREQAGHSGRERFIIGRKKESDWL